MIPLVSVIIPCFNCDSFIAETIQSVLDQSYQYIEIIIVDDGSTDKSFQVTQQYKNNYPEKIKLYKNPYKGACSARNYGFKQSKGEYIQYLDADDLLSSDKIEIQLRELKENNNKLAICNCYHFYDRLNKCYNTDKNFIFSTNSPTVFLINLWGGNGQTHYAAVHSYLTPRHIIAKAGNWNESLTKDQDGEFFARVILNSEGIIYTSEVKSYYRKFHTNNNISSQKKRIHIESNYKATELKEKHLLSKTQSKAAHLALATQYKLVAIDAWPNYYDITKQALLKCKELGESAYTPILGGKIIEAIKKIFGWKFTKAFTYYIHKLI